ncbi:delta-lactam-biosynthetic de-N-acetylase [Clostridium algidicarnis]|uniref:delta-lactam-biosynthetic de-N-acetylase n=1 Tax=Clostridium algidicarnis TaxID=37659 RepID=UPI001C0CCAB1|nr:delta-lactam-biosynthetic de-N-acetylase [Clostridium algidicarnis]MBU3195510.1 delta-lactam-biosynthetic de-N-acetylase [Clostridium algidicarnis]
MNLNICVSYVFSLTILINSFSNFSSVRNYTDKLFQYSSNDAYESKQKPLDTNELNWYFNPRSDGLTPEPSKEGAHLLKKYDAYYVGDTTEKVIYLTFDEGYENGYTNEILDILKKHNVKAAFFVVKPYIESNPDIIKRMVEEGHLVCNHTCSHPSMALIKDKNKFNKELLDLEISFENLTGKKMAKYFRPPMGKYSELSLNYTKELNYKTIFWSFAYNDWDIKKQPTKEKALETILKRSHSGAIILLHAVSKTNADILDEVITKWESEGYTLKSLDDLP